MSKEVILDLACVLDEAEVNDRAQQLSSTVVRRDEVDTEKRNVTKGYNERLSELEGRIRALSKVIRERAEYRPVTCAVQFHKPAPGTKRTVRKDTGEIVRDEPMSSFEHQNNLFEEQEPVQQELAVELVQEQVGDAIAEVAAEVLGTDGPKKGRKKLSKADADVPNGFDH